MKRKRPVKKKSPAKGDIDIKALRQLRGWSQERLAQVLGVTWSTVNRWENGHTKPSPLALRTIQELLKSPAERPT
jgi:DNA-binding transcriptional regulator YiaG